MTRDDEQDLQAFHAAGLAPSASRFFIFWGFHILFSQTGVAMFRFIAALGRTFEVANSYGNLAVILQMILVSSHGLVSMASVTIFMKTEGGAEHTVRSIPPFCVYEKLEWLVFFQIHYCSYTSHTSYLAFCVVGIRHGQVEHTSLVDLGE